MRREWTSIRSTECLSKTKSGKSLSTDGYGIRNINNEKPNAEESKQFWNSMWVNEKKQKRNAEWVRELRSNKDNMKQNDISIATEMIKKQVKKISNWKRQGPDGAPGYWLKKLTIHECTVKQMDNIISNIEGIPKWMILGKKVLCQKYPSKWNVVDNYRPISCLNVEVDDRNYCWKYLQFAWCEW